MGTVLAMLLCEKKLAAAMWGHDSSQLLDIKAKNENVKFLPGYKMPPELLYEPDDAKIMADADLIVSAVPCQFMRGVWKRLKKHTPKNIPIVSITKGIENQTLLTPVEILKDVLGEDVKVAVLSGPTIADELAQKLPATACVACADKELAQQIQKTFNAPMFRVYTNDDIAGVELAGAMKNVIAIAAGILDGIKAGSNAKAALITRGLAEITRMGTALGAKPQTFSGLAGLGDLVTTCISLKGRNRSFGEKIGTGQSVNDGLKSTHSVIEGAATCESVIALAKKHNVEMPITQAVYEVLFDGKPVKNAIADLMARQLKSE